MGLDRHDTGCHPAHTRRFSHLLSSPTGPFKKVERELSKQPADSHFPQNCHLDKYVFMLSFYDDPNECQLVRKNTLFFIRSSLFAIIYYVLKHGIPTFLNLATISIYPIAIQYLIFVLAKHKTFDFYALIPFSGQNISQPLMLGIAFLAMLLEPFWLLFYLDENSQPIKKGSFICVFTILLLTLIYDALIVTGQFGLLVSKIPFVYYESWRAINFGQYIVYLDIFAFFYWITSAFCRIT